MEEIPEEPKLSKVSAKDLSLLSSEHHLDDDGPASDQRRDTFDERRWRLSYLKTQFKSYELQSSFKKYTRKINHGYFSVFLILFLLVCTIHAGVLFFSTYYKKEYIASVLPDLIIYIFGALLSLLGLFTVDKMSQMYGNLHRMSLFAFIVVFGMNIFVPLYHKEFKKDLTWVRPVYTCLLTISCYVFFDIYSKVRAVFMGLAVTAFGMATMYYCTYKEQTPDNIFKKVIADVTFLLCVNALGIYLRFMNEVTVRKSFLDRRDFIMSTHQLRFEKNQMDQLMSSIIPRYLIDKVVDNYIQRELYYAKNKKIHIKNPFEDTSSLLDEHDNVSILFADIVNYTKMTQQLNVTDLLETLNEMFGMFDDYSEELKVSRIKFLGDCYYCVAGLPPNSSENPAEACVDLGLAMISVIEGVRKRRNLNIYMRIGVHTGKITSGIIGTVKYQFDIWSRDVDIANKMESCGSPGKVHITNKTKELLKKQYNIIATNRGETEAQLKQYNLQTFLISPSSEYANELLPPETILRKASPRSSLFKKQKSLPNDLDRLQETGVAKSVNERSRTREVGSDELDERAHSLTIIERNNTFGDLSEVGSARSSYKRRYSNNPAKNPRISERQALSGVKRRTAFMDNNIKRYVERSEAINKEMEEAIDNISFSKYRQYLKIKEINSIFMLFKKKQLEIEYIQAPDPLFKYYLVTSLVLILSIYLIQYVALSEHKTNVFFIAAIAVNAILIPVSWTRFIWNRYVSNFVDRQIENKPLRCMYKISQQILESFWVRLFVYTLIVALSSLCVIDKPLNACKPGECAVSWDGETINYRVNPILAHIFVMGIVTLALHLIDRQTDYMNRLDFLMNKKVKTEQEEANVLKNINKKLLNNILPEHVANIYLDVKREMHDLYYEEHEDVAVMFASLVLDEELLSLPDKKFLAVMNEYISSFDILTNRKEFSSIEKIKLAKWTYMAACGLKGKKGKELIERHATCSSLETLLNFAAAMYKALENVNKMSCQSSQLRIGICTGPVIAGVVGSRKPLYDIWGDAVNMASRMDSTGLVGHIQVMEKTAELVKRTGIGCVYRGEIDVKGVSGKVRTYFVKLDEAHSLVRSGVILE
ncbi:unnamed protein product [Callosobruchus maculatus]|uniref:adenylate cyclase n=2 Tax=Callosobruchus maculatus TaxID=64391 RepID=A0A653BH27_CALMS|nr:unnamed protein product [Callosobruchus maculatus]